MSSCVASMPEWLIKHNHTTHSLQLGVTEDTVVHVTGMDKLSVCQGAFSLKLLGGKLAPKLIYFVLRKELLKRVKWHPGH